MNEILPAQQLKHIPCLDLYLKLFISMQNKFYNKEIEIPGVHYQKLI